MRMHMSVQDSETLDSETVSEMVQRACHIACVYVTKRVGDAPQLLCVPPQPRQDVSQVAQWIYKSREARVRLDNVPTAVCVLT